MKKFLIPFLSLLLTFQIAGMAEAQTNDRSQNPDEGSSTVVQLSGEIFGTDFWGSDDPDFGDRSYQMAFDGDISTFFDASDTTIDAYIGINVGVPTRLTEVRIVPRNSGNYDPEITIIDGSGGFQNEGHDALFDRDIWTKWCSTNWGSYVIWKTDRPMNVVGYQMLTAFDTGWYDDNRNPAFWTLYGSVNGEDWLILDEANGDSIPDESSRIYEKYFDKQALDENGVASQTYEYFKLEINGLFSSMFQLAEFRLLETSEELHRLNGLTVQGSSDGIYWTDLYTFHETMTFTQLYIISADEMSDLARDFSFTQFRIINKEDHLNVAEVEFYGYADDSLQTYPVTPYGEHLLNYDTAEWFGTDSWSGEEDNYKKAFDRDPYTFYDAHETSHKTHVGIAIDSPAKLTEVRIFPRADWAERMASLTIEGSVNGNDWVPLYRFPETDYECKWYEISEDMFASAAHQYSFTQFRLTNPQNHLNVAEVEFIGTYEHDLPAFPVVIGEPIYSYYSAEQFLDHYSSWDGWYFEEWLDEYGMTRFEKDFEGEEPIALLGGAGFDETEVVLDRIDGCPVFAVMPWAFSYTNGIREVTVGEDSSCRYIFNDAFRGCKYLEYVTVSNAIYDVWFRVFAETPSLKRFIKIDTPLSDEKMSERPGRYAEVYDDALIVTTENTSFLNCYPSAKEYTETFTCPENVTIFEQYSFYKANIGKIIINSDIAIIDGYAFEGCQAHTLEINTNIEQIHEETFLNMPNLEKVIFRGTLTEELNLKTFNGCSNLQEIEYHGDSLTLFYDKEDDFVIAHSYDENENPVMEKFRLSLPDPQTAISLFLTNDHDINNRDYATCTYVNNPYFYTVRGSEENVPGDINGDSQISVDDYLKLQHYTAGWNESSLEKINLASADIDGDGNITAKDRMILARYLDKWDGYSIYFN